MKTEYQTPKTVAEIGAVFLSLTPMRDTMIKSRLSFWTERFGTKPMAELTPDDIDAALAELETAPGKNGKIKSGPTVNRYRMALQSAIRFAKQKRLLPRGWASPLQDIPQHKENPGKVRFLTLDEEQRLMDAARLQTWVLLPLLIRLAIVTGLRRGALLGLRWFDLTLEGDAPCVTVARTKNGDSHISPITPDLIQEFKRMKRIRSMDDDLIFSGKHRDMPHDFRHGFMEACKLAGLEGVTFHTLRHTSCSRLAQAGVDILAIAEHAGHRSLTMTRRYSHLCIKGRASTINTVFA
ncbi:tyrosine-type recombinase/integrase [Propionivibrio sp.]|uniref:tyrosine-type recombinase/integrase n=1 Tax=Propionivibrio sp. TaxID=2212460 RepID=UPI003BF071D3